MSRKHAVQTPGAPIEPAELPPEDLYTDEVEAAPVATEPEQTIPEAAKPAERPKREGELPDKSEIDPKTIDRAVLTKQGWIVPDRPQQPVIK